MFLRPTKYFNITKDINKFQLSKYDFVVFDSRQAVHTIIHGLICVQLLNYNENYHLYLKILE